MTPYIGERTKKFLLNSDPVQPRLYGLPKMNKEGIPMGPTVKVYKVSNLSSNKVHSVIARGTCGQNHLLHKRFKILHIDC